jgi:hypothetical protein
VLYTFNGMVQISLEFVTCYLNECLVLIVLVVMRGLKYKFSD